MGSVRSLRAVKEGEGIGQMMSLAFHPLAEVLPLIEGSEFDELVNSIQTNGLRDSIITLDDKILDGRNRYRACLKAGVQPRFEPFTGSDPVAFVADKNLRRRHLTCGQKAMAVAKFAMLSDGNPHRNLTAGIPAVKTIPEIAAMAGINKESVSDAKTIQANGTEEEIASVVNGAAAISTVAKEVRARRDDAPDAVIRGCRIAVPDGMTVSEMVRGGMRLEGRDETVAAVAKQLGMSVQTYVVVRDAILLSRRDDLSKKDIDDVVQALCEIDEIRQVGTTRNIIIPIAQKIWGRKGNRHHNRRSEQFDNAISFLLHTCENAVDIIIPYLNHARADGAVKQLSAAETSLRKLRERIREAQYE